MFLHSCTSLRFFNKTMAHSCDEKENDQFGTGTFTIKKADLEKMINSRNSYSYPQVVSRLIFNNKSKQAVRITLSARPANSGKINLPFNIVGQYNNKILQVQCAQPYFYKYDSTSYSTSVIVDKSALLSPASIAVTYVIKHSQNNRCFSAPAMQIILSIDRIICLHRYHLHISPLPSRAALTLQY